MELKSVSSLIYYVADPQASVRFYESLGFRASNLDDSSPRVYLNWFSIEFRLRTDDQLIAAAGQQTGIKVDDVQATYDGCITLGLKPLNEPTKVGKNREFVLSDPDGYQLLFFGA